MVPIRVFSLIKDNTSFIDKIVVYSIAFIWKYFCRMNTRTYVICQSIVSGMSCHGEPTQLDCTSDAGNDIFPLSSPSRLSRSFFSNLTKYIKIINVYYM